MSSTSIVDYNDTDTLKCMGAEILDVGELTDDDRQPLISAVETSTECIVRSHYLLGQSETLCYACGSVTVPVLREGTRFDRKSSRKYLHLCTLALDQC